MKTISSYKGTAIISFLEQVPSLKKEFVRMENEGIDPYSQGISSQETVLWKCSKCGYKWTAQIRSRIGLSDSEYFAKPCPKCRSAKESEGSYLKKYPKLKEIYSSDANDIPVEKLSCSNFRESFTFICPQHEDYKISLEFAIELLRQGRPTCPKCRESEKGKSLGDAYPELAADWSDKNKMTAFDVAPSSRKKVLWCCSRCHTEWWAIIASRVRGYKKCPTCSKKQKDKEKMHYIDQFPVLKDIFDVIANKRTAESLCSEDYNKTFIWKCDKHECYHATLETIIKALKEKRQPCPKCRPSPKTQLKAEQEVLSQSLIEEWSSKNQFSPSDVAKFSTKEVWWKCSKCGHEWKARVTDRTRRFKNCPKCFPFGKNGKKLSEVRPDLKKYYSTENSKPFENLSSYDSYLAIWECDYGHKFPAKVSSIAKKDKFECARCKGLTASEDNNFAFNHPDILKEWDYEKNNKLGLDPYSIMDGSIALAYWKCKDCGKSYQLRVSRKIEYEKEGTIACPYCAGREATDENNVAVTNPEILTEWDYEANNTVGLDPHKLLPNNGITAHWICKDCGSHYVMSVSERVRREENGQVSCPYCRGWLANETNCLATTNPEVLDEWDYDANEADGIDPHTLLAYNGIMAHWVCKDCGSHYVMSVSERVRREENGQVSCPYCRGWLANETNCLTKTNPEVLDEWDYDKNKADGLDPHKLLARNGIIAHWICSDCGSHYDMRIKERVQREENDQLSCPYCRGWLVNKTNCLATTKPEVMKEWYYPANSICGLDPNKISERSSCKAWWKCPRCGYIYPMAVNEKCLKSLRKMDSCMRCKTGKRFTRFHFV